MKRTPWYTKADCSQQIQGFCISCTLTLSTLQDETRVGGVYSGRILEMHLTKLIAHGSNTSMLLCKLCSGLGLWIQMESQIPKWCTNGAKEWFEGLPHTLLSVKGCNNKQPAQLRRYVLPRCPSLLRDSEIVNTFATHHAAVSHLCTSPTVPRSAQRPEICPSTKSSACSLLTTSMLLVLLM